MHAATRAECTLYVPIDEREPSEVRVVILARESAGPNVDTQVKRCRDFITERGWTLTADRFAFAERDTSGIKKRPRPVLGAVLALAEQRKIDVIVASEYERVDRNSDRRAVWKATAERFGVEFRFANLPPTGKLPDTMESRIIAAVRDVMGELEAARLRERTLPGLLQRAEKGLPGSGRSGPAYGYCWRAKRPGEKAYSAYELVPEKAERVRNWYERLDRDETLTLRQIARELHNAGVPTPTGSGQWMPRTISYILKNPIYCGRARLLRYAVTWEKRPDEHGELWDERRVTDRLRDADAWESETLPLADDVLPKPYLVSVELWERVQQRIAALQTQGGKLGRHEHPADATLLHGGFVRCAHCDAVMTRYWHRARSAERVPYYRCSTRNSNPHGICPSPVVPAQKLDRMVLDVVAYVMSHAETLCDWADANEAQMTQATQEVALANATLDALRTRLDDLTADAARYRRVLDALDSVKDAEEIAKYRDKLQHVAQTREKTEADLLAALPKRDHAQQREWLLHALRYWSEEWPRVSSEARDAAARTPLATVLPHIGDSPFLMGEAAAIADALHVMPYDLKRRLLRDLRVVARVSRPRSRAERAERGRTPLSERVVVRVGELDLRLSACEGPDNVDDDPSVTNAKGFYVGTEKDPAATR